MCSWLTRNQQLNTGENVACAQPIVSHKEDEIQNSNSEYGSSKCPNEDPVQDDRKPEPKRI